MPNASTKGNPARLTAEDISALQPQSQRARAWQRFRAHRMAMVGLMILILIIVYIVGGSFIYSEEYANDTNIRNKWAAPSIEHPMGTDSVGRDLLARTIYGGQISLAISVVSVVITMSLGTFLGLVSGFYGGFLDSIIMRISEALMAIPGLFLLLVLTKFIGTDFENIVILGRKISGSVIIIIFVLGFTGWMGLTRIVRGLVLSLREQEFVLAAKAIGANNPRIIFTHILPNVFAPVIVATTLGIAGVILAESAVSFLGLGVQPPTASWGNIIQRAPERIETAWWVWFFPGSLILLTVLGVNFVGDGLRDALDPRSKKN